MSGQPPSLTGYYREHHFNPVLIRVEESSVWRAHLARRRNLYERHLGIPLALLRSRSVLELGPNSGENALVPALWGASLTLVEPNDEVLPRLRELFTRFGVADRIAALRCEGIESFTCDEPFDLVLAEGFLCTLPNRDDVLRKLVGLVRPGGLGVVSFNDRYGGLLELLRRMVLFRACRLAGVEDVGGPASLDLARRLFAADFARLSASRTFEAWWKDTLVSPFYTAAHLWSFDELLPLLASSGCELYSSSPLWATSRHYAWYKDLSGLQEGHRRLLEDWRGKLPYILSGLAHGPGGPAAGEAVLAAVADLGVQISCCTAGRTPGESCPIYPEALDRYLAASPDERVRRFNGEMRHLVESLLTTSVEELLAAYHGAGLLRGLWGTAYHYLCFRRGGDVPPELS
jgi:SAM-dependent methyltransferase